MVGDNPDVWVDYQLGMETAPGLASGAVNVDPNEQIMRKNINHAVKKLMKQYPPKM